MVEQTIKIKEQQMIIKKKSLPDKSILREIESSFDYVDSFGYTMTDKENKIDFPEVANAFLQSKSVWISTLMSFRDKLVKPFGLKISDKVSEDGAQNFMFEKGARLGIFKVFDKVKNELILGENDKHLNFRVSISIDNPTIDTKNLAISSTVIFNNWFGRLYLLSSNPFITSLFPKC